MITPYVAPIRGGITSFVAGLGRGLRRLGLDVHVVAREGSTSEEVEVERSADGRLGDEALAEAVLTELREDALTTDLQIHVHVRNGIAHLRGRVADVDETEAAEEVARRVPGLEDIVEELEVAGL